MKYLILVIFAYMLSGCSDKHSVKPFECKCNCNENSFECIGVESDTEQDSVKKFVKNKF